MHDGTLNNYGLSEVTVSAKGTASINDDGKLGKCYYLDGTSYMTLSSNMMEYIKDRPFSYGCWFKTSGLAPDMTICGVLAFTYGCSLYINADGRLIGRIDNGENFVITMSVTKIYDSKWHHLFLTYDGATMKIYIDGKMETYVNVIFKNRYTNVGAIGTELNNPPKYIGKGYINDVKVYDNCLSEKEIKLLAQGLVLHYPLNQIDRSRNLLKASTQISLTGSDYPDSTSREKGKITVINDKRFNAYTWVQGNLAVPISKICEKAGEHFTFSCKIKTQNLTKKGISISLDTRTDNHQNLNIANLPIDINCNGQWQELCGTLVINHQDSTRMLISISSNGITDVVGATIEYKDFKLEYGSNSNPIWTPAWEDSDSWLDSTEYDCSGLCNNGISVLPPP